MENDLIRRSWGLSAAKTGADDWDGGCNANRDLYIEKAFAALPAVDAVEVRHGQWRFDDFDGDGLDYTCSRCGLCSVEAYDYCPNCGARMDGQRRGDGDA